jgi:hypothetical protein
MPAINPILESEDLTMAKALLGHIGGPDPRMLAEMRRLQQQIRDLESELVRLQEENDVLSAEAGNDMLASVREQAHLKALDATNRVPRPERMPRGPGLRRGDGFSRGSWPGYCRVLSRPDPPPWPHPSAGRLTRRGQSSCAPPPGPTGGGYRRKTP